VRAIAGEIGTLAPVMGEMMREVPDPVRAGQPLPRRYQIFTH
jgi:hypothetical protein